MRHSAWCCLLAAGLVGGCDAQTQSPPTPAAAPSPAPTAPFQSQLQIANELSKWAKDYPRAIPAEAGAEQDAIEVFGTFEAPEGIAVKSAVVKYNLASGGRQSTVEIKYKDGKWGEIDPKDMKVVPARVRMAKGQWNVWVWLTLEGKGANGNTTTGVYTTSRAEVEIK